MKWFTAKHTELSDDELLVKAKNEDTPEYATALFTRYIEYVYGACLKYYKNEDDAKDKVMDVYHRYLSKIKVHDVKNPKSWLYVLTKNFCLEKLRKENRDREKLDNVILMQSEEVFHPFNEEQIGKEESLQKMEKCIETLEMEQKRCIKLFYLKKHSYKEITEELGLSWSNVRSLIQNGRRNLKHCMEKHA